MIKHFTAIKTKTAELQHPSKQKIPSGSVRPSGTRAKQVQENLPGFSRKRKRKGFVFLPFHSKIIFFYF